jgi:succinate dehydrogenase / fumarate reductase flavoprotein subunit
MRPDEFGRDSSRRGHGLETSTGRVKERVSKLSVNEGRAYNPWWNLATELPPMITVCTTMAQGAINRKEPRGGHTRENYSTWTPNAAASLFVHRQTSGNGYRAPITIQEEAPPEMPTELQELFEDAD